MNWSIAVVVVRTRTVWGMGCNQSFWLGIPLPLVYESRRAVIWVPVVFVVIKTRTMVKAWRLDKSSLDCNCLCFSLIRQCNWTSPHRVSFLSSPHLPPLPLSSSPRLQSSPVKLPGPRLVPIWPKTRGSRRHAGPPLPEELVLACLLTNCLVPNLSTTVQLWTSSLPTCLAVCLPVKKRQH